MDSAPSAQRTSGAAALRAWARGAVQQSRAAKRLNLPEVEAAFLLAAEVSVDTLVARQRAEKRRCRVLTELVERIPPTGPAT